MKRLEALQKYWKPYDSDLVIGNIKVDVPIFGVAGSLRGPTNSLELAIGVTGIPNLDIPVVSLGFGSPLAGAPSLDIPAVNWS